MKKIKQLNTIRATRSSLKPLLMAIPLSVLAACASNQPTSVSDHSPTNTIATAVSEQSNDHQVKTTQTNADEVQVSEQIQDIDTSNVSAADTALMHDAEETNQTDNADETLQEGNNPMTVLVIENPELLSKLANEHLKPVVSMSSKTTPTNSITEGEMLEIDMPESLSRPSKRVFHFGFNQSQLSEEDIELVEQHAAYLKANPELQVTIHGHTDAQGNAQYNLTLSEQRAAMMVAELRAQGIDSHRIKKIGWGGGYPLVNSLNYAENRRIEIEYSVINVAANQ